MPFIVQCPHAECRKFMLLEDSSRGGTAECLLCKKPIKLDGSSAGEPSALAGASAPVSGPRPATGGAPAKPAPPKTAPPPQAPQPAAASAPAAPPPAAAGKVVQCPHCKTPLRLPAGNISAVKCPKCAQVFKV